MRVGSDLIPSSNLRDVKRAKMLEAIKLLRSDFDIELQSYANRAPLVSKDQVQLCQRVVHVINEMEQLGNWDESLFLRNLILPMREIKNSMEDRLLELNGCAVEQELTSVSYNCQPGQSLVYILLFQTQGYNIGRWEQLLRSLERAVIGRPIYEEESHVQHIVSRKTDSSNNAYAVVKIAEDDILDSTCDESLARSDRYGHKLLTLQQGCINSDNILGFTYQDETYKWENSRLKIIQKSG